MNTTPTFPHAPNTEYMQYNSTLERLRMPQYGRAVQRMVEHALTIEDRAERQRYAETIVSVMMGLSEETEGQKLRRNPDFVHKTWDHLAYISDYRLDVDYPFEITLKDGIAPKPVPLSYPGGHIRFRHYGRIIERALKRLAETDDEEERALLTRLVANRMKRNLADWKGDGVEDEKVAHDIAYYTEGRVVPDFSAPGQRLIKISDNNFRTRRNKAAFK